MKDIESHLTQKSLEDTKALIYGQQDWFFNNRLYLPDEYANKWLAIRNGVDQLLIARANPERDKAELVDMHDKLRSHVGDAINEIYKLTGKKKLRAE